MDRMILIGHLNLQFDLIRNKQFVLQHRILCRMRNESVLDHFFSKIEKFYLLIFLAI